MDAGQNGSSTHQWPQHGFQPAPQICRPADIISVLSGLREEVDSLENEIQKVENDLLSNSESKVLNRKFERLVEEKKNKEARRERLELQLIAVPDHVHTSGQQTNHHLLGQSEVPAQHSGYHYPAHVGAKRARDDSQAEYVPNNALQEWPGISDAHLQAPRGQGRGGKGGFKYCKRCRERITYGHQQKCKFCKQCYDDSKELVFRSACPHGHSEATVNTQQQQSHQLLLDARIDPHQEEIQSQQHQLQQPGHPDVCQIAMPASQVLHNSTLSMQEARPPVQHHLSTNGEHTEDFASPHHQHPTAAIEEAAPQLAGNRHEILPGQDLNEEESSFGNHND